MKMSIQKAGVFRKIDRNTPVLFIFDVFVLRPMRAGIKLNAKQLADICI